MEAYIKIKKEITSDDSYQEDSELKANTHKEEHHSIRFRENGIESANAICNSPSPSRMTSKKRNHNKSSSHRKNFVLTELDSIKKRLNFDGNTNVVTRIEASSGPRTFNYERPSILKMR